MTTDTLVATRYPGDDGREIPQFPERLEKDIGNILGSHTMTIHHNEDGRNCTIIDRESLIYGLLEYITQNYEHISKTDKTSS